MKKTILVLIFGASAAFAETTYTSGTYNTWLGYNAGGGSTADFSVMLGSYAGQGGSSLKHVNLVGVMSAHGSEYLEDCFISGFRAMQDASNDHDVIAIGNCAGRNSAGSNNCIWLGRDAGRGHSENNTIRILNNWYNASGDNYTPDALSAAKNTYFFGVSMMDMISSVSSECLSVPYNISDLYNDVGYPTYDDIILYVNGALSSSGYITLNDIYGSFISQYVSGDSLINVYDEGGLTLSPYYTGHYSSSKFYGISFRGRYNQPWSTLGFITDTSKSIVEQVHEQSVIEIEQNGVIALRNGANGWIENPENVYVGGTNKTSAVKLTEYVRSIANVQSVNGKTGAINLTAADVNALPALPTNTVVNLRTDDDAMAAIKLILETMGATVITNTPTASN